MEGKKSKLVESIMAYYRIIPLLTVSIFMHCYARFSRRINRKMPPSGRSSGSRFAFLGQVRGAGEGWWRGRVGQGSDRGRAGRGQGRDGGINWEDLNTHAN